MVVESDGADGAGFVANMVFGCVRIGEAAAPGDAFAFVDQIFVRAERDVVLLGEFLRAGGDEHHVLAVFEDAAREAYGIPYAFDGGDGAGFERVAVHEDGV